jgi:hypothetical protein
LGFLKLTVKWEKTNTAVLLGSELILDHIKAYAIKIRSLLFSDVKQH